MSNERTMKDLLDAIDKFPKKIESIMEDAKSKMTLEEYMKLEIGLTQALLNMPLPKLI